jgi:hypothetical protein
VGLIFDITILPSVQLQRGVRGVWVRVSEGEDQRYAATFDYGLRYLNDLRGEEVGGPVDPAGPVEIRLWRVCIDRPSVDVPKYAAAEEFTLSLLRELPLQTWESAAREYLTSATAHEIFQAEVRDEIRDGVVLDQTGVVWTRSSGLTGQDAGEAAARRLMQRVTPHITEGDTPASRRTFNSHLRLARVAVQYSALLMEGRNDPSQEIARLNDLNPGAARSLVFRARQVGYLGKAIGRTAGNRQKTIQFLDDLVKELEEEDKE